MKLFMKFHFNVFSGFEESSVNLNKKIVLGMYRVTVPTKFLDFVQ